MSQFATKLRLRSFQQLGEVSARPAQQRPKNFVLNEGSAGSRQKYDPVWIELSTGQWIRIVRDQRPLLRTRIFRIELWDNEKKNRTAVFRRGQ